MLPEPKLFHHHNEQKPQYIYIMNTLTRRVPFKIILAKVMNLLLWLSFCAMAGTELLLTFRLPDYLPAPRKPWTGSPRNGSPRMGQHLHSNRLPLHRNDPPASRLALAMAVANRLSKEEPDWPYSYQFSYYRLLDDKIT